MFLLPLLYLCMFTFPYIQQQQKKMETKSQYEILLKRLSDKKEYKMCEDCAVDMFVDAMKICAGCHDFYYCSDCFVGMTIVDGKPYCQEHLEELNKD